MTLWPHMLSSTILHALFLNLYRRSIGLLTSLLRRLLCLHRSTVGVDQFVDMLCDAFKGFGFGEKWSIADVRKTFCRVSMVCRRRAKDLLQGIDGLSQMCERPSVGYRWSVADVRKTFCRVSMVYCRRAKDLLQGIDGLSQTCERPFSLPSSRTICQYKRWKKSV